LARAGSKSSIPLEELRAAFREIDRNKDGFVARRELVGALRLCGLNASRNAADLIIDQMDKDVSGKLDLQEFVDFFRRIEELNRLQGNEEGRECRKYIILFLLLVDAIAIGVLIITLVKDKDQRASASYNSRLVAIMGSAGAFVPLFCLGICCPMLQCLARRMWDERPASPPWSRPRELLGPAPIVVKRSSATAFAVAAAGAVRHGRGRGNGRRRSTTEAAEASVGASPSVKPSGPGRPAGEATAAASTWGEVPPEAAATAKAAEAQQNFSYRPSPKEEVVKDIGGLFSSGLLEETFFAQPAVPSVVQAPTRGGSKTQQAAPSPTRSGSKTQQQQNPAGAEFAKAHGGASRSQSKQSQARGPAAGGAGSRWNPASTLDVLESWA